MPLFVTSLLNFIPRYKIMYYIVPTFKVSTKHIFLNTLKQNSHIYNFDKLKTNTPLKKLKIIKSEKEKG